MPLDRQSLKREFYRLTNTSDDDDHLTEHDNTTLESVWQLLEQGLYDAQLWLISAARPNRWLATTATLTVAGTDDSAEGKYVVLIDGSSGAAEDMIRLAGSRQRSPLYQPSNRPHLMSRWGEEVDRELGLIRRGNWFWLEEWDNSGTLETRLRFSKGATIPTDLVADYFRRATWPTSDGVDAEFPRDDWRLIVGEAADTFASHAAFPYGDRQRAAIRYYLGKTRTNAKRRNRRTQSARRIDSPTPIGTHWFGGR